MSPLYVFSYDFREIFQNTCPEYTYERIPSFTIWLRFESVLQVKRNELEELPFLIFACFYFGYIL